MENERKGKKTEMFLKTFEILNTATFSNAILVFLRIFMTANVAESLYSTFAKCPPEKQAVATKDVEMSARLEMKIEAGRGEIGNIEENAVVRAARFRLRLMLGTGYRG